MSATTPLPPDSYTARRLEHATPHHLHQTTRRVFIGPLPAGWIKSHRKQWYRDYVGTGARRAPSFTAAQPIASVGEQASVQVSQGSSGEAASEEVPRNSTLSSEGQVLRQPELATSITSLLHSHRASLSEPTPPPAHNASQEEAHLAHAADTSATDVQPIADRQGQSRVDRVATKLQVPKVRFSEASRLQLRARAQRLAAKGNFRTKVKDGEMMKVDKMLIRTDITQQTLREDYDEKASQGVETKSLDKWREFVLVCRKHTEEDAEAVLQFYQTRVIAVSEGDHVKKKPKVQILLSNRRSRVNLYSSLDKTLCLWTTNGVRTTIYYLRAQSTAAAVEWYTFLCGILGHERAQTLQVNVPDLSVSLRLDDPFRVAQQSKTLAAAADGDDEALAKAVNDERGAAGAVVSRCIEMLQQSPEWADVLRAWALYDRIGLAWKRYDRLEWIYGEVEQRMYGTIAMQRTHDLELRPKDHYPMLTSQRNGPALEEPPPVEGFLIRLTSQKGKEQRLGKMLFKRLYFATYNQFLVFLRPAKATPPRPPNIPRLHTDPSIPSAKDISEQVPLAYEVDPYPFEDGHVTWLGDHGINFSKDQEARDKEAETEAERNVNLLMASDGFINLCDVKRVRKFLQGATAADEDLDEGSDVDFHAEVGDTRQDDGATTEVDEDRIFELVMNNRLVIRLQAFNKAARNEWMKRLKLLVEYWRQRAKADVDLYKATREQNLKQLGIDDRAEALVGQFAHKWEVSQSYASPSLYNMCGIAECRTIHLSGTLFRKPRKHTTFARCQVILSHGHLLIFQDTLRRRTGQKLVHIHHERIASIDLQGCYLYSGLLTENDLLYQNQTFDSNAPGHHALPRIYLEDNWTSTDEDAMTTFVIWHAKSRSWFKSSQSVDDIRTQERSQESSKTARTKTKLTRVSQLGATGRSVVFKARSRAERDHWVLAIQVEIERLAEHNDEVRIVDK